MPIKPKLPKLKEKVLLIDFPQYAYTVKVVVTNNVYTSGVKHLPGQPPPNELWFAFHTGVPGRSLSLIVLPLEAGVSTISHEAFHCVWEIMQHIGADHENEVMAYTLGYLVREIAAFMWPERVMKKKPSKKL